MVTHDPGAAAYADRVVFLVDGAIVKELEHPTRERVLDVMGQLGELTMLRFSLRNLLVNKLRLLLTLAAVTVGVSFVSGTYVLSDTMVKAFDELYDGLTSGTDVVVRAESPFDADVTTTGGQLRPLDDSIVDTVRGVPGVAAAEGSVAGFALILDKDGEPIQPGGAPTFGTNIHEDREMSGAGHLREGQVPSGPDELVVDAQTANKAGFLVGDQVTVIFEDGRQTFTLVGIVGFGETDSILGATLAGFDLANRPARAGQGRTGGRGRRARGGRRRRQRAAQPDRRGAARRRRGGDR